MPFGCVPEVAHAAVHVASCFELDVIRSTRFDRIYVGAGARASDARFLSRLLKPGGIIVGPFERDTGSRPFAFGAQSLLKATREDDEETNEATFRVDDLMAVQFAPLSRRVFDSEGTLVDLVENHSSEEDEEDIQVEEEAPPEKTNNIRGFVLKGPTWGIDSAELFSPCFVDAVASLRRVASSRHPCFAASQVPWHLWHDKILSLLAYDDVLPKQKMKQTPPKQNKIQDDALSSDNNGTCTARRPLAIAKAVARWTLSHLR